MHHLFYRLLLYCIFIKPQPTLPSFHILLPSSLFTHLKMAFSPSFLLLIFLSFFLSLSSSLGDDAADINTRKTYIIAVRNDLKPPVFSDVENWYTSLLHSLSSSTHSLESSSRGTRGGHKPLHVYRTVFLGFSSVLTPAEANLLRSDPAVLAVLPDRPRQLHTTRSPLFLGLVSADSKPNRLLAAADSGSSVVIALVDTGIRPDHPSFADDGRLSPSPSRWNGSCDHGSHFPATTCNRKLVGARFFDYGYLASTHGGVGKGWDVFSPMDSQGHGTHTASTAAGGAAHNASLYGYATGVASGIAPGARIAVYKACWASGCYDSDIIAAIDAAVTDGANVISISIGAGVVPLHVDPIAISTLGAAERGVFVAVSAGNDGPSEYTVCNVAPWVTTVGAGTVDRRFPADIILGDGTIVSGVAIQVGRRFSPKRSYPLVYAGNAARSDSEAYTAAFCDHGYLEPNKVRGRIVLCDRGGLSRVEKGLVVKNAGGDAMILANESTGNRSTEWAYGSGHVDPEKAVDPGLVYDLTVDDYLDFLCSSNYSSATIRMIARRPVNCRSNKIARPWDMNYPSIAVVLEQSNTSKLEAVVHRTVTNVGEDKAEYSVGIKEPEGVRLVVEPPKLVFGGKGQKQEFVVKVFTEPIKLHPCNSCTEFGSVTWSDGKRTVRSPIAVTWQQKD